MKQTKNITMTHTKAGIDVHPNSITFPVVASVRQHVDYRLFLYGAIESPFDFAEAINALEMAEQGDTVTIHLSSPGGCVSSVDALLHAINMAQERGIPVHCISTGLVASAGTFIILTCSSYECSDGTHFLFHNGSLNDGGSYNQFRASATFFLKYMEERFRSIYEHFLSSEELDGILEGKDLWLTVDEFAKRYEQRNALVEAEMKEALREQAYEMNEQQEKEDE